MALDAPVIRGGEAPHGGGAAPPGGGEAPPGDGEASSDAEPLSVDEDVMVLKGGKIGRSDRNCNSVVLRLHRVRGSHRKLWRIRTSSSEAAKVLTGKAVCHRPLSFEKHGFFVAFREAVDKVKKTLKEQRNDNATGNLTKRQQQRMGHSVVEIEMSHPESAGEAAAKHSMLVENTVSYCSVEATLENIQFIASHFD